MNIPIVRRVLEKNDRAAAENRALFDRLGLTCVNVLGGAGCGKTALLEAVLPRLRHQPEGDLPARPLRSAVLEGDLTTTRDAERIAALDVPVVQLLTDGGCHLTAVHVGRALAELDLEALDLLIIENVGNPVCPANFDLGEHARLAVLSVPDGDDKPSKYPLLFRGADLVAITKCDLLPYLNFNLDRAVQDIRRINPLAPIVPMDTHTDRGVDRIAIWLERLVHERLRATAEVPASPSCRGSALACRTGR